MMLKLAIATLALLIVGCSNSGDSAKTSTRLSSSAVVAADSSVWTHCANENEYCSFSGTQTVRFGANGTYATQVATGGLSCSNMIFGDPAYGQQKSCDVLSSGPVVVAPTPAPTATPANSSGSWIHCANENEYCSFSGTQTVRFGANGSYATQVATGGVSCSNMIFGDPASGYVKSCDISATSGSSSPASTATPVPTPVVTPVATPSTDAGWSHCADEGGTCVNSGSNVIRFGVVGHYNMITTAQSVVCSAAVFGDPIYGVAKSCDIQAAGASQPVATPTPAPPVVATPVPAPVATPSPVVPTAGSLRIETLGDSITFGYGQTNYNAYRGTLVSSLISAGYSITMVGSMNVGNFAQNATDGTPGWEINDVDNLVTQSKVVSLYAPDTVILMVGTNDFLHNVDPTNAPARLSKLIEDIRASISGVRLIVASVAPTLDPTVNAEVNVYNAAVRNLVSAKASSGEKIYFADINSVLTVNDLVDGVHPNDAGYVKMGLLFESVIINNGL